MKHSMSTKEIQLYEVSEKLKLKKDLVQRRILKLEKSLSCLKDVRVTPITKKPLRFYFSSA